MPPIDPVSLADAAVIGGSYAGLSAALQLARARRRVVVIDAGQRRNRFASASHGFLGQDGRSPGEIVADARAQLLAYPNVEWRDATATQATATAEGFRVSFAQGTALSARKLVLATGVIDGLPPIEGVAARWGQHVFHCPYCHGYELDGGHIGVLAVGPVSLHHALMLPDWGTVTFFTNEAITLSESDRAALDARGVTLEPARVVAIEDEATVALADGRRVPLAGLFVAPRTQMASPIAEALGCAFDDGPMGPYLRVDAMQQTSVPGVFACGDAARAAGNVALAVGDGAMAGAAAHRALMFG
ncbi:NAD(P)/FAD-dependent oxidoreductase [Achromobacter sp. GG226]|uniref:NAD(P)/FAD-dependent oxidoreductase n=1 Tax=Verticiella alkaliphila TaxID=2779529 RepID=UPI001C0C4E8E|nr:NAD(P)/FAD-dependent oxidoreductase [Verticiella sp. GG226]MBU4609271.1 NAD(P)/FAD-dependent oxidoreductase [Verticiella sp. GG226]